MHDRIEKSAFTRGRYIGYAAGVWHIERHPIGWRAYKRDEPRAAIIYGHTLDEIGRGLDDYAAAVEGAADAAEIAKQHSIR